MDFLKYLNFSVAFAAWWRQELLETVLAIQIAFLLNEADVHKFTSAVGIHAQEVSWAPSFSECSNEWSSVHLKEEIYLKIVN
jgi:hypothetical protein